MEVSQASTLNNNSSSWLPSKNKQHAYLNEPPKVFSRLFEYMTSLADVFDCPPQPREVSVDNFMVEILTTTMMVVILRTKIVAIAKLMMLGVRR